MPEFERAGVAVFAISYDPVSVLASFAQKRGITYELLSDEGSRVIRDLGLLNEHLAEQAAHYGLQTRPEQIGVPYPGTFVLDENGIVVEKRFEQSYRVRPTAASFLEESLHQPGHEAVRASADSPEIIVDAWLGSPTYHPYQKQKLGFSIRIGEGLHVHGQPVPEGYTPLTVEIDPLETLEQGPIELPAARPFRIEDLDEDFLIYDGTIRGSLPFMLQKNLGDTTIVVRVRYQACTDTLCYPPGELTLEIPFKGEDNIRD